ncbi:DNA polymerase III subunit chi [Candidatus Finniella inopinata]|uniref:DNA polymerase III subunit chi n=1 Tax=Candidatus Finniella inopinata TaxID=1696036 RepID=A0A4V2DZY4_9PROT|nr:DNA polymerase III subunit chi [Candidatus Finniella inopinata]RZI46667.1 DNA polymerase III subunit chi [Candidatus Finniella inopinata]
MDIVFYQLTATSMEKTLPKLLEKAYDAGQRAVVLVDSEERLAVLNASLWTYSTLAFLPHGCEKDSAGNADRQPIWLTTRFENPNQADVLVITSGETVTRDDLGFQKCLDIFDGNNQDTLDQARLRAQSYQEKGHTCTYWRQTLQGQWENLRL